MKAKARPKSRKAKAIDPNKPLSLVPEGKIIQPGASFNENQKVLKTKRKVKTKRK